jgi:hypothetical protein
MKKIVALFALVGVISAFSFTASAKPVFAKKEGKACNYCHSVDQGGGPRGFRGIYYGANKLSFKGFDEKKESEKAGVKEGATGTASKPTKPYTGKK